MTTMPPSRFEARNHARAIPLVTISLANGSLRQTRLANDIDLSPPPTSHSHSHSSLLAGDREHPVYSDHPPPYDTISASSSSHDSHANDSNSHPERELATVSPKAQDVTEAVLHLSRTLVSTPKAIPRPNSSWVFMMIYSWTHTQRTATRLLHILSKPTSFLRDVQDQNEQALILQQKKQRRSVQQMTEEQDRLEDDPNMTDATELMPVSMMNTRSVATMEESLPEDPEAQSVLADTSDDEDSSLPRKPKRRMDRYSNPFGTGVSSDDELEDDEGWFGRGDERSENGHRKTDSVLLTTPAKLTLHMNRNSNNKNNNNKIPDFPISSLGAAMDPHQFENSSRDHHHHHNDDNSNNITRSSSSLTTFSTSSLFNTPRNVNLNRSTSSSTFANRSLSHPTDARPQSTLSVSTSAAFSARRDGRPSSPPSPTMSETPPHASFSKSSFQDTTRAFKHHDAAAEARQESPSQFDSLPVDSPWTDGHGVLSTSATFAEFASTVINTSTSGHSITSSSTISSFNGAVS